MQKMCAQEELLVSSLFLCLLCTGLAADGIYTGLDPEAIKENGKAATDAFAASHEVKKKRQFDL